MEVILAVAFVGIAWVIALAWLSKDTKKQLDKLEEWQKKKNKLT